MTNFFAKYLEWARMSKEKCLEDIMPNVEKAKSLKILRNLS